ncbi:tetratricopeptide repeat protein [Sphingobium terrigena]|nr:tetratricopeptide repeat protein [Sphingobium terrigena]
MPAVFAVAIVHDRVMKIAILMIVSCALLSCADAGAVTAQSPQTPVAVPIVSAPPVPTPAVEHKRLLEELAALRQKNEALALESKFADLRVELIDNQTNWFEIVTSSMIGLFGVLITVIVIFFALRFGKAAVAEAREELRKDREDIVQLLADAKASVAEIQTHRETAKQLIGDLKPGEVPTDPKVQADLREIADAALAKPRRDRSIDDYRALVMAAFLDKDWSAMERRSSAMIYMFEDDIDEESLCFALFNRAYALGELDQRAEAIAIYGEIVSRFSSSEHHDLQTQVAMALLNQGYELGALNRRAEALVIYDDIMTRFGKSHHPELQERVAKALVNKGIELAALNRRAEAITVCDDVVTHFGGNKRPELQEPVARALINKGLELGALDRKVDAITTYDDIVKRFGGSENPDLQTHVAKALVCKGVVLGALDRGTDALVTYDDVVARFGDSEHHGLQQQVAKALVCKGCDLGALDQGAEALIAYNDVVMRFAGSACPDLQKQVANALFNTACIHALDANVADSIETL